MCLFSIIFLLEVTTMLTVMAVFSLLFFILSPHMDVFINNIDFKLRIDGTYC